MEDYNPLQQFQRQQRHAQKPPGLFEYDATSSVSAPLMMNPAFSALGAPPPRKVRPTSTISKTYRQSSTLFLTRRIPEALTTLLPLITPSPVDTYADATAHADVEPAPVARASRSTRVKVWSLYLTILNAILELPPDEGKDSFGTTDYRALCNKVREGEVWEEVVRHGFHGVEGNVDADIVVNLATLLLAHGRNQMVNQKRLEAYLAFSATPQFDFTGLESGLTSSSSSPASSRYRSPVKGGLGGTDTPKDLGSRIKILELYTLHVLLRNEEWAYAREYVASSPLLDEERREAFLQALESLHEEHLAAQRQEAEEKLRHQEEEDRRARDTQRRRQEEEEEQERQRRAASNKKALSAAHRDHDVGYSSTSSSSNPLPILRARPTSSSSASSRFSDSLRHISPAGSSLAGLTYDHGPEHDLDRGSRSHKSLVDAHSFRARAAMAMHRFRLYMENFWYMLQSNPLAMMKFVTFVAAFVLVFAQKAVRVKIQRMLARAWLKLKATAGMGVKVSYV